MFIFDNIFFSILQIDFHFHYLEITAVESKRSNLLCLTVGERIYNFTTIGAGADTTEVDAMIEALHTAIRNIFPTVPLKSVTIQKLIKKYFSIKIYFSIVNF